MPQMVCTVAVTMKEGPAEVPGVQISYPSSLETFLHALSCLPIPYSAVSLGEARLPAALSAAVASLFLLSPYTINVHACVCVCVCVHLCHCFHFALETSFICN